MSYMLAKKHTDSDPPDYRKQLEYLYARRSTIDHLIEQLEQYDRFRAKGELDRERQSA
jgi:hypothetical protein